MSGCLEDRRIHHLDQSNPSKAKRGKGIYITGASIFPSTELKKSNQSPTSRMRLAIQTARYP
jgi:hypothetical protein